MAKSTWKSADLRLVKGGKHFELDNQYFYIIPILSRYVGIWTVVRWCLAHIASNPSDRRAEASKARK
jgi:hypothetical protein